MAISAKDVMALRQKTGLGMMDCKKALTEADGDMAAAEEILRATRKKEMDGRSERPAAQGRLAIAAAADNSAVAIIEINAETDFTARNDSMIEAAEKVAAIALAGGAGEVTVTPEITEIIDDLRITTGENISFRRGRKIEGAYCGYYLHHDSMKGAVVAFSGPVEGDVSTGVCQHITAHIPHPEAVDADDLPSEVLDRVRKDAEAEAAESGKPAEIIAKMVEGKVRKFVGEATLVNQKYVKDPEGKKTIAQILPDDTSVQAFDRYVVGL
ncbi:MAG: translation elongation factor Ts [Planctomycetes bacterium]|nr:translation elongation factor Ts [Planctomycetota bacterium]NOG55807.1 translation elongation factor Ts [Planctomycetota bacterium]